MSLILLIRYRGGLAIAADRMSVDIHSGKMVATKKLDLWGRHAVISTTDMASLSMNYPAGPWKHPAGFVTNLPSPVHISIDFNRITKDFIARTPPKLPDSLLSLVEEHRRAFHASFDGLERRLWPPSYKNGSFVGLLCASYSPESGTFSSDYVYLLYHYGRPPIVQRAIIPVSNHVVDKGLGIKELMTEPAYSALRADHGFMKFFHPHEGENDKDEVIAFLRRLMREASRVRDPITGRQVVTPECDIALIEPGGVTWAAPEPTYTCTQRPTCYGYPDWTEQMGSVVLQLGDDFPCLQVEHIGPEGSDYRPIFESSVRRTVRTVTEYASPGVPFGFVAGDRVFVPQPDLGEAADGVPFFILESGIWIIQEGAWIRPPDFASGMVIRPGTMVFDQNGGEHICAGLQPQYTPPGPPFLQSPVQVSVKIDTDILAWKTFLQPKASTPAAPTPVPTVSQGDNIVVTPTVNADGGIDYNVATSQSPAFSSITLAPTIVPRVTSAGTITYSAVTNTFTFWGTGSGSGGTPIPSSPANSNWQKFTADFTQFQGQSGTLFNLLLKNIPAGSFIEGYGWSTSTQWTTSSGTIALSVAIGSGLSPTGGLGAPTNATQTGFDTLVQMTNPQNATTGHGFVDGLNVWFQVTMSGGGTLSALTAGHTVVWLKIGSVSPPP
jgi:hypothetical protein